MGMRRARKCTPQRAVGDRIVGERTRPRDEALILDPHRTLPNCVRL